MTPSRLPPLVRLLRPHQYAKNLLVFAAPGAAGRLDDAGVVGLTIGAFVLFCAVSSAGYVANDLIDIEADRLHPTKKHRPLADGSVAPRRALIVLGGLITVSLLSAPLLGWDFFGVLAGYGAVSATYSALLKRIPWLELVAVSAGFLLRAVAGGAATDTPVSGWFLLVVSAGAMLVITGKRLGELLTLGAGTESRKVLAGYSQARLKQLAVAVAVIAVAGYGAWAAAEPSEQTPDSAGSLLLRLTSLPFALAIGRYLTLSWRGAGETPESLIVRDRITVVACIGWAVLYTFGLYA